MARILSMNPLVVGAYLVFFVLFLIIPSPAIADEALLRAENEMLKKRIAELEEELKSFQKIHPMDKVKDGTLSVPERIIKPIESGFNKVDQSAGGWAANIHEGIERVDKFFYEPETKAWGAIEYQVEGRAHNTMELFGGTRLPAGFSTFAFFRWESSDTPGRASNDFDRFFIELDLQYHIANGFGVVGEYNDEQFDDDRTYRLGIYYAPDWQWLKEWDLVLFSKYFPWASQDEQYHQWTIAWNWTPQNILDGRFSINGFYEINALDNYKSSIQPVTDVQFLYRLFGNFSIFTEYRYNLFEEERYTWVNGVQYKF